MIFESLMESADRNELLLVEGGLCRFHRRKDGIITIREIVVLPWVRRKGIGTALLERIKQTVRGDAIRARCPVDLPANGWYQARGFRLLRVEKSRTGREINVWQLDLS